MLVRACRLLVRRHPRKSAVLLATAAGGMLGLAAMLRWMDRQASLVAPEPTRLVQDVQGRFLAEVATEDGQKGFWPLPAVIPPRVLEATLAAEDARYFTHSGVEAKSILRAAWQNLRRKRRVSGASTLAMQVARLQAPGPRTYRRKVLQAVVGRALVKRHGHDAVLRHYLRIAPYGNQNHGIVYAARRYFRKPLEDLTWAECALLAGLPKLPGRMNLMQWEGRQKAERRARYVLDRLKELGKITAEEHGEAKVLLPDLRIASREARQGSCLHAVLAMEEELKRPSPGACLPGPSTHLLRSTLDLELQDAVQLMAWRAMEKFRPQGAGNLAVLVAEKGSGRILAYLGSEDYFDSANLGAIDYARRPRSSGSTLKPFVYALGMTDRRFTAASLLTDIGMPLNGRGGGYTIRNFDEAYLGPILYRNALANSRNAPAVQVLEAVGVARAYQHFCGLGLAKGEHEPSYYGAGLALGTLPVTLVDLVRAYGILASEGRDFRLRWFDGDGAPAGHPLIPEEIARQVTLFLSDPMARLPSFPRMGALEYPFPVAIKTGTSQGFRDAWCVAYTERFVVGVWMGHPRNYAMNHASGAAASAEVVRAVLEHLHPEEMKGLADHPFPPPRGWQAQRICLLSGRLASEDCPSVAVEWFKPGTEPPPEQGVHRRILVDTRTGRAAAPDCPPAQAVLKAYTVLDPRFTVWAKESGLELLPPELDERPENRLQETSYRLTVTRPRPGTFLQDPEVPLEAQTLSLEATVTPPVPQVVWYVDGKPYKVVDYPYTARWRMQEGAHTFEVRLPYAPVASAPARVLVKP